MRQAVHDGLTDRLQHRVGKRRQAIVNPQPVAPSLDEAGAADAMQREQEYWRVEGPAMLKKYLPKVSRTSGIE
jgi:hypothetical protein